MFSSHWLERPMIGGRHNFFLFGKSVSAESQHYAKEDLE
jgi:hypothetical protein